MIYSYQYTSGVTRGGDTEAKLLPPMAFFFILIMFIIVSCLCYYMVCVSGLFSYFINNVIEYFAMQLRII